MRWTKKVMFRVRSVSLFVFININGLRVLSKEKGVSDNYFQWLKHFRADCFLTILHK